MPIQFQSIRKQVRVVAEVIYHKTAKFEFVPLNELPKNGSIRAAARISGWRFFVVESDIPIAAANVIREAKGELRLDELNEGQFVAGTLEALKGIFREFEGDSKDRQSWPPFELLLLVVPAMCFVGWWAQFEDHSQDWIVPVSPPLSRIKSKRVKPKELIRVLQEEHDHAAQVLESC